jgi:predicted nucleic acid-binding protein
MNLSASPYQARRAFLDSSAFLSLFDLHDQHHQEALDVWTRLTEARWRTFTTNFVVAETHSLFLVRLGQRSATEFLRGILQSSATTVRVNLRDEERARAIVFQYNHKDFSITDATSFAVMERLGIPYAFTFDRHFAQYGLAVLSGR